jgi:hypothetical protein
VTENEYLTPEQIRAAFERELATTADGRLNYGELAARLRQAGFQVRGNSPKRQRDNVYNALLSDKRIERCGPGEFRLRRI